MNVSSIHVNGRRYRITATWRYLYDIHSAIWLLTQWLANLQRDEDNAVCSIARHLPQSSSSIAGKSRRVQWSYELRQERTDPYGGRKWSWKRSWTKNIIENIFYGWSQFLLIQTIINLNGFYRLDDDVVIIPVIAQLVLSINVLEVPSILNVLRSPDHGLRSTTQQHTSEKIIEESKFYVTGLIVDLLFDVAASDNVDLIKQSLSLLQCFLHSFRRDQTLFKTNEHPFRLPLQKESRGDSTMGGSNVVFHASKTWLAREQIYPDVDSGLFTSTWNSEEVVEKQSTTIRGLTSSIDISGQNQRCRFFVSMVTEKRDKTFDEGFNKRASKCWLGVSFTC